MRRFVERHTPGLCYGLLGLGIVAFALYFSLYQLQAHAALWTGVDLTNVSQTLWNTLHGRFMRSTVYPPTGEYVADFSDRVTVSRLGTHVQSFFLALLLPYGLCECLDILMVLMCLALALGAVPAYRLALRRFDSPWAALAVAWLYLLLPAVQTNAAWDVHGTSFLPPLLLAGLDAAERGKRAWWWLWILLAMGCREDVPFLAGWAMLWLAPREERRTAVAMFGVGLLWSVLSFFVIIPHFGGGGSPFLAFFFPPGTSITLEGIVQALRDPQYWGAQVAHFLEYNLLLGLPFLFLYYLHWPALLAMAPLLVLNGLSWNQAARLPFFSHYSAPIVAWAWVGTVAGVVSLARFLRRRRPRLEWRALIVVALLMTVLLVGWMQGYLPYSRITVWPRAVRMRREIAPILADIPDEAVLSANIHLAPQLARRPTLRFFPDTRDADWLALDVWNWADPYGPAIPVWETILADAGWEMVAARDGVLVLRRGNGPPQDVAAAFVPQSASALPELEVSFGAEWRLTGAEVFPLPLGHFVLCTDWVGTPPASPVAPGLRLTSDATPQPLDSHRLLPSLYQTAGVIRDCTQLSGAVPGSDVKIWLSLADATGEPLSAVVREASQDWEGHVDVVGTDVRLEVPAW
jgi:uncharacterized membrane protein